MSIVFRDQLVPGFEGPLLDNKYLKASLFIVKTTAQRNSEIKKAFRSLDGSTTTLCYVSAEGRIYELINNPSGDVTIDSDWKQLDFGVSDILVTKGSWSSDNTNPVLQDSDAVDNGNDFYIVTDAQAPTVVQHSGLFQDQAVTVTNGDWVISNGDYFFTSAAPIGWNSISGKPQVIDDYVAGTVIVHPHVINDVTGLQLALDEKYDDSNVASLSQSFNTISNEKLSTVGFLRQYYHRKYIDGSTPKDESTYSAAEIDVFLEAIVFNNQDPDFDWNRAIRKLPKAGEIIPATKLGEGIEDIYFGIVEAELEIESVNVIETGDNSIQPIINGSVSKNDGNVTAIRILDENDVLVDSVVPDASDPQQFQKSLPALVGDAGDFPQYKIEIDVDYGSGAVQLQSGLATTPVVYPFLFIAGAENITAATLYGISAKNVESLSSSKKITYGTANQHLYFAYPDDYSDLVEAIDESGSNVLTQLFKPVRNENVDSSGLAVDWSKGYKIYESRYPLSLTSEEIEFVFSDPNIQTSDDVVEGQSNLYLTQTLRDKLATYPLAADVGNMDTAVYDPDENGIIEKAATLAVRAKNTSGGAIASKSCVYVTEVDTSGAGFIEISTSDNGDVNRQCFGVTQAFSNDDDFVEVVYIGLLGGVDTSGRAVQDPVYLGTSGAILFDPPTTGFVQKIGSILHIDNIDGVLFINPEVQIFNNVLDWQPFTVYEKDSIVVGDFGGLIGKKMVRSKVAQTSSANFITDYNTGTLWELTSGDMDRSLYDPNDVQGDAFDMDNMVEGATTKVMTDAERTKLAGLEDPRYKGIYADLTALQTAYPTADDGDSADVIATSSTWVWSGGGGGSWSDSGIGIGGDMLISVYDPTTVAGDAFDMDNMSESATKKVLTNTERTKLAGIEENAKDDQTAGEIKAAYESNLDTNAYTDAEKTKLSNVEENAKDDQTGAEIKVAYESEADTNAYTDAEKAKLGGITAGADMLKSTYDVADKGIVGKSEELVTVAANNSGGNLTAGTVVYIESVDVTAERFNVSSNDDANTYPVAGVLIEDTNDTEEGTIVEAGIATLPNLPGFSVGDKLYLGTGGALLNSPPTRDLSTAVILIGVLIGRVGLVDYIEIIQSSEPSEAAQSSYDPSSSTLSSENIQDAIDELAVLKVKGGLVFDSVGGIPLAAGEIVSPVTVTTLQDVVSNPAAGRIAVDRDAKVMVNFNASIEHDTTGDAGLFQIHVNGVLVADAKATTANGTGSQSTPMINNPSISWPLELNQDDYVSIFYTGDTCTLYNMQITLQE